MIKRLLFLGSSPATEATAPAVPEDSGVPGVPGVSQLEEADGNHFSNAQ